MRLCARKSLMSILAVLTLLAPAIIPVSAQQKGGTLEILYGGYSIKDARFKAIYPGTSTIQGIALSIFPARNINLCLEITPLYREGRLTYSEEKTNFVLLPLSLTARYIRSFGFLSPYIGLGADMVYFIEDNPIGTVIDFANGFHFQGGTYLRFGKKIPIWLNLKFQYTGVKAKQNGATIDLGGWQYAIGLAFVFK